MQSERPSPKLAAILFADVAGYSRLMSHDELATVDTLSTYRAVFSQHVSARHGRLKTAR